MLSIISQNNDITTQQIEQDIKLLSVQHQLIVAGGVTANRHFVNCCNNSKIVILIGDVFECKQIVAQCYGLQLSYDKQLAKSIAQYHKNNNSAPFSQHQLDNHCALPEGFAHYTISGGGSSGCWGKINNCQVFVITHDYLTASNLFGNYIKVAIDKMFAVGNSKCYKVFGINNKDLLTKLALPIFNNKIVSHHCETSPTLDSKVIMNISKNATLQQKSAMDVALRNALGNSLYASTNISLPQAVVALLQSIRKTVAFAESMTGGMLASQIVDVEGASKVLVESAVTYATVAKQNMLGINPHMIDTCGVVSNEVAREMAVSIRTIANSDYSVSITGYAGPTADINQPVGLCYIGIASNATVRVFKTQFVGFGRQQIREQAVNSALFLLLNTINNVKM